MLNPQHTLDFKWPFGQVLLQSVALLIILFGSAEVLARNEAVRPFLLAPQINGNDELGGKLLGLDRLVARSGHPDCIIIGSSMVLLGINPDILGQAYAQKFHQPFRCYVFGITSTDLRADSRLATILAQEYHPRLLIFGTSFRDFKQAKVSLDIPWADYYLGSPSLDGWLNANSYSYRYASTYFSVIKGGRTPLMEPSAYTANGFISGHDAVDPAGANVRSGPEWDGYARLSSGFRVSADMKSSLEQMLALNTSALQVVIVEMPLAPGVYDALPDGQETHQRLVTVVSDSAARHDALFLQTQDTVRIPDDGWNDLFHLNENGADTFTRWLGIRIVAALENGQLHLTP